MWILNYNRSRFNRFPFFMQKLSGKSRVMLYKRCRVLHKESNKIEFAVLWFSTIFYEFYKNQHKSNTIEDSLYKQAPRNFLFFTEMPLRQLSSHLCPWLRRRARRWRGAGGGGKQVARARDSTHIGPIGGRNWGRGCFGERRRWVWGDTSASAQIPARIGIMQGNKRWLELQQVLVEIFRGVRWPKK
jgi:hypothetical protein